jgi:hypothetical protein
MTSKHPIITVSPGGTHLILRHQGYPDLQLPIPEGIFMWGGHFSNGDISITLSRDQATVLVPGRLYYMPRSSLAAVARGQRQFCRPQVLFDEITARDLEEPPYGEWC